MLLCARILRCGAGATLALLRLFAAPTGIGGSALFGGGAGGGPTTGAMWGMLRLLETCWKLCMLEFELFRL